LVIFIDGSVEGFARIMRRPAGAAQPASLRLDIAAIRLILTGRIDQSNSHGK
jgi:hypothetical protein